MVGEEEDLLSNKSEFRSDFSTELLQLDNTNETTFKEMEYLFAVRVRHIFNREILPQASSHFQMFDGLIPE